MSPPASKGPYRKPQADLYTMMLLVAWLALVVGTVFLYLEVQDYGTPPYPAQGIPAPTVRAEPQTPPRFLSPIADAPIV